MGSVSLKIGDGTARFRRSTICSSAVHLVMLTSVVITNIFALYAFNSSPPPQPKNRIDSSLSQQISSILSEISLSERKLHQIERDLAGFSTLDPTSPKLPPELRSFLSRHPLPLGKDSRSGMTEMVSSVAHSCIGSPDLLSQFMSYRPHSPCPSADLHLPSKLLSLGCDPLPRRRCLTRSLSSFPSPSSSYSYFKNPRGKNDFSPESVAALLPPGTGRIAFDFHAPAADFASAMAAHNVTVVTSSPAGVSDTEGLLWLAMGPGQRFPFYDNVFDLVHTAKGLDRGGPEAVEFLMFDIDRVLRPGGLFWLDNLYCGDDERKRSVTRLVERFGYKKLKWVVGERTSGEGKVMVYLSAVLQKPVRG